MRRWDSCILPAVASSKNGNIIHLDGRQTHYLKQGSGPPLILLHGYFYDCQMWNRNIDALAEHYTVYALDFWGVGLSCRGRLDFSYTLLANQILLFMDSVGIETAAFCGQGMGGGTIIHFASLHPRRVDRMILVDTAGQPDTVPWTARLMRSPLIALPLFKFPGLTVRRYILSRHFVGNPQILEQEYLEEVTAFQRIRGSSLCLLDMLQAEFFHSLQDSIEVLSKQGIPALIVWGENDCSNPLGQGRKLQKLLPDSRLDILPGAGHVSNADQPELFNQLSLDFLSDL